MSKPNVLYITHRVPHPPNRGDRIRTYHFLRHLAQHANVWLATFSDEPVAAETHTVLGSLCRDYAIIPVEKRLRWVRAGVSFLRGKSITEGAFSSPKMSAVLKQWGREIDFNATLSSSSALTPYQRMPFLRNVPAFVDLIDVDSQKWSDYSAASSGWKKWVYASEARRLRVVESDLADWASGITVVSEPEANIYRGFRQTDLITAIPNGVDVNYFTPSTSPTPTNGCVFVGVLDYKPNVDGICWFSRNVWPEIHQQRPTEQLRIVGRSPAAAVLELGSIPGVNVVGGVPDVRPYLSAASVVVVPLQIARGVQNKVLEALAMAKPVVASPEPIVGLDVADGTHLFRATSPTEWVSKTVSLLDDADLRSHVGLAGHTYVNGYHRWDQCLASLNSFLKIDNPVSANTAIKQSVRQGVLQ